MNKFIFIISCFLMILLRKHMQMRNAISWPGEMKNMPKWHRLFSPSHFTGGDILLWIMRNHFITMHFANNVFVVYFLNFQWGFFFCCSVFLHRQEREVCLWVFSSAVATDVIEIEVLSAFCYIHTTFRIIRETALRLYFSWCIV